MPTKFYGATSLTGGGAGALDAIDGTGLADADGALVITPDGVFHYRLIAASGATHDPPEVIAPATNAGTKRWHREQDAAVGDINTALDLINGEVI